MKYPSSPLAFLDTRDAERHRRQTVFISAIRNGHAHYKTTAQMLSDGTWFTIFYWRPHA